MISKATVLAFLFLFLVVFPTHAIGQAEGTFQSQCASCHGSDGDGATPAGRKLAVVDLRSKSVQSMSDDELFNSIAYGVKHREYPHGFARRGLSTQQINDLVAFIRTLPEHKIVVKSK